MPSTLLTLLDDIATILDDVALMSKVALKKTAGVVGDDLALNAQQMVGIEVDRELPVVLAVAKGSTVNKLILVPTALVIGTFISWTVHPLLMLGGAFLCFEGVEKLIHKWLLGKDEVDHDHAEHVRALSTAEVDLAALEKDKIRGAVRTDFILSAEIIVIALGSVADQPFLRQLGVLATVAVVMTVGVYGLVVCIIKLDDLGLHLSRKPGEGTIQRLRRGFGRGLVKMAPYLMRGLSVAGTVAMFTVGGGILTHGVPSVHHAIEEWSHGNALREFVVPFTVNLVVGVAVGAVAVGIVLPLQKLWRKRMAKK